MAGKDDFGVLTREVLLVGREVFVHPVAASLK
jgi:hypothetical protein